MNTADYISHDIILHDALMSLNDAELRSGFSRGWYVGVIQRALEELAQDTFFDKRTIDVKLPTSGAIVIPIPENIFNVQYMYIWNGSCCTPSSSQKVWWKRNFNNKGNGTGYLSDMKDAAQATFDPFIPMFFPQFETIYYANIQEGKIMFSATCSGFGNVSIICNGFGGAIGDKPAIPKFFRQTIIDFVRVEHFKAMASREPRVYRVMLEEARRDLGDNHNGSWKKARIRISSMQTFEKKSMEEYFSFLNA